MDELKKYIGTKIKEYRKSLGMTTIELSKLSNTSQTTISTIERGKRFGTIETMLKICEVLRVTLYDILPSERSENLSVPQIHDKRIALILDRLSAEDIEVTETLVLNNMSLLRTLNKLTPNQKKHLSNHLNSIINND
ncbi:helix-turn-helix domain-containing protein [Priestia aryabhattai]